MPGNAVQAFLKSVRQARKTGQATAEQSYYPAVNALLDTLGAAGVIRRRSLAHPAGIEGALPDVALYEESSNVLVLPVEVKPASYSMDKLIKSQQARGYAEKFGGGKVLLTNLREWVLCVQDGSGKLKPLHHVTLATTETALDSLPLDHTDELQAQLQGMIEDGSLTRGSIRSAQTVATLLAFHARNMRDAINSAGNPTEMLAPINNALQKGLAIDLEAEKLVPTVVQTLVYGEFAAWLSVDDSQRFDWMQASYRLKVPVFAEILHEALRPALIKKCDLTKHLNAVARVLSWTDRDSFTAAFDGDAIQYFYEPFLAKFDANLRDALGVWYTPKEIAAYQVARTDFHLRTDLGVKDGLADPSVYLLDPACGTGTYLVAACQFVYDFHITNGEPASVAATRAAESITKRFIGFEILPAAFIICHLHLARFLATLGAETDDRLRVYLTNSLIGWTQSPPTGATLFPELEEELRDAGIVKHHDPILAIIGNPPYQGYSSAETPEEKEMMAAWSRELTTTWKLRKHRLNDLYVRFWRVSIERIVALTGMGIISFISNRKWLAGRSYPSMRAAVVNEFDRVIVDDLHGSADDQTQPGDESIFTTQIAGGIKVGTAIVTAIRTGTHPGSTKVALAEYRGSAAAKRGDLTAQVKSDFTSGYGSVSVSAVQRFRFTADVEGDHPSLDEYLPVFKSGVQTIRDQAVMDVDREALSKRMKYYFDASKSTEEVLAKYPGFGVKRAGYDPAVVRARILGSSTFDDSKITRLLFRPFDTRWVYWEPKQGLLNRPRPELYPYWRNVEHQICLITPQTPRRPGAVRPVVGAAVGQMESAEPNARVFPLYAPPTHLLGGADGELNFETDGDAVVTTVAPEWVSAAAAALGSEDRVLAGEVVFYAILAVMQSPSWAALQSVDLDDFPEMPIPGDPTELKDAALLGRNLALLLDPDASVPGVTIGAVAVDLAQVGLTDQAAGTVVFDRPSQKSRDQSSVMWDEDHGWRNISDEAWAFSACGFAVLPKWLSYRNKGVLTANDRETFRLLARRVQAIVNLGPECDNIYAKAVAVPLSVVPAIPGH